jgi:hypothetical protein
MFEDFPLHIIIIPEQSSIKDREVIPIVLLWWPKDGAKL